MCKKSCSPAKESRNAENPAMTIEASTLPQLLVAAA